MSIVTYYLGANTPQGFCSHYDSLLHDSRIRRLYLLKGGPGCGKSTLMRHVSAAAQKKGYAVEEIPCSSDPSSLDGLIVPDAGLALADGTAPHVLEPPLCGLGAQYLDLGRFYNPDVMLLHKKALLEAQQKNKACYPLCYLALQAAEAASELLCQLAADAVPTSLLTEALQTIVPTKPPELPTAGVQRSRFLSAFTPEGIRCLTPQAAKIVHIRDSFGLSALLMEDLLRSFRDLGHSVIAAYDPLRPAQLQAILLPSLDTAYLVSSRLFPFASQADWDLDLDALVFRRLHNRSEQRLHVAEQLRNEAVEEALHYLHAAKRHHDALEAACRPAVDFAAAAACADEIAALL